MCTPRVERSVLQWRVIDGIAAKLDSDEMHAAQQAKDAVRAYELVCAAFGACVALSMGGTSPGASRQ